MKKLIIIALFAVAAFVSYGQGGDIEKRKITAYFSLKTDSLIIIGLDTFNTTTKVNYLDAAIATQAYVDSKAAGIDSSTFGPGDYYMRDWLNGNVHDSTLIDSTFHSAEADTSKFALNVTDSLSYDTTYWFKTYINDVVIDSVRIDSVYHAVKSDTADFALNAAEPTVITVTLAGTGSVQDRINASTEGVDYPTGWILTADVFNIIITHNLGRWVANVKVQAKTGGTVRSNLKDTNAYANFDNTSDDEIKIYTLSTESYPLVIYLIFE